MRRTRKDVDILFEAYCQAWEHSSLERVERLESHGWVAGVWVREYDNCVRMRPTDTGRAIIHAYWEARKNEPPVFEQYNGVPALIDAALER